jgi:hypothetical protein
MFFLKKKKKKKKQILSNKSQYNEVDAHYIEAVFGMQHSVK